MVSKEAASPFVTHKRFYEKNSNFLFPWDSEEVT